MRISDWSSDVCSSDLIDPDHAVKLALGLGYPGIAWAGDDIDRADALGAVGERGNGLRAANAPDFIHPGDMCGGQNQRIDVTLWRRCDHHQSAYTRNARWNRIHQQRGGIGRPPPRAIPAAGTQRAPYRALPATLS